MAETSIDERRWTRGAWLTVLAAGIFIALNLAHVAYRFSLPSLGWVVWDPGSNEGQGQFWLVTNAVEAPSALQPGDVVTHLGALELSSYDVMAADAWPRPAQWRVGGQINVTVERQGQTLVIAAPVVQWTGPAWWRANVLDPRQLWEWVVTALLLGLVGYTLAHRPGNLAARFLFAVGLAQLSISLSNTLPDHLALALDPPGAISKALFGNIIFAYLLGPAFLGFALTFPRPKAWIQRQPRWLLAPFLLGATTIVLLAVLPAYASIGFGLTFAMLVSGLGALLHSGVTQRDAISRAQLRWAVGGVSVGVSLFLLNALLFPGQPLYREWLSALASLGFPVIVFSLTIAILRYRLFDIDLIIRRTLIYSLLTALLALTYFGLVIGLQGVVSALGGARSEWVTVASTLAVAALVAPLRVRVQRFIDRRFYRRKYDAARVLSAFGAAARDETDLNTLTGRLTGVVQETMEPESVGVWLRSENIDDHRP